ncbi:MAG: TfoX/Sxy family protein [Gemmatimonadota bacterium]|jgi:TfoX/Sxy family transcriptional regulator of competence genes
MASDPEFAEFAVGQFAPELDVTARKMFGEYGLYSGDVFFAMICDNHLFVKPTEGGRAFLGDEVDEAPPYPGARPSLRIGEALEDGERLSELARITVAELPPPKRKKRKTKG